MKWKTIRADEFCESVRDGTHDTPKQTETGYKLLTSKHIKNGQITPVDAYYISEEDYKKINARSLVEQWDVIMSMIGTVGEAAVVRNQPNYAIKNVALFKCAGSELKGKWLAYYLSSPDAQGHMSGNQKGSSQQFLSLKQLRSLQIPITDEPYMLKVVDILSAYDDSIENNQKQIKLLEEAAQRLYKEWFVDLRFPGHENTKITDGVPEGWRMAVLSEIASVNKESISKQYPYDYVDYIDIGSVSKGQISSVTRLSTKDAPGRAKRIAFDGDVLWGMVRPNLKSYALVFHPKETSVFSTGFAILHAEKVPFSFLYCHVTQDEFVSYLINCTNGAAYPAVKPSHFENAVLLVPTDMVLSKFHSLVGQMFRQAEILEQKNQQAIEARDRLLPKLMSGEIEV